jgi:hypothetical protein
MSAYEWTQVVLECNARPPLCREIFEGERGLRPTSGETAAMVRKRAARSGWTLVRKKIGRHNYDQDYCPAHKPEESGQ